MELTRIENERRSKFRFAFEQDLRYKLVEDGVVVAAGSGKTINLGSGGVAFVTERPLIPGGFVEISISWPVLLYGTLPLRFIVFGRVLRCTGHKSVCTIEKHEFRTQALTFQAPAPPRADRMLQRWVDGMRKGSHRSPAYRTPSD